MPNLDGATDRTKNPPQGRPDPLINIWLNTPPLGYPPVPVLELKDSKFTILRGNNQYSVE